jgi:alcohol dehydrogenase (cytochrome c)
LGKGGLREMKPSGLRELALALVGCGAVATYALAEQQPTLISRFIPPTFTDDQAQAGRAIYNTQCAACHGPDLGGNAGRPLKGRTFMGRWGGGGGASMGAMYKYIRDKMPPGNAGSLSGDQIASLIALILKENGIKPGSAPLPADYEALQKMHLPFSGDISGGLSMQAKLPPWPAKSNPATKLAPVTDALLQKPPPSDWLSWRRTLDGQGFSPLAQITAGNVGGLHLAWSFNLSPGPNAATPLVHDGVIYVYSYRDQVDALNAATGEVLWTYKREQPAALSTLPMRVKRNMALYGDLLYFGTGDDKVVALNAKTGQLVWESPAGQPISGGPIVVNGVVVEGLFRGDKMPGASSQPGAVATDQISLSNGGCMTCGGFGRVIGLSAADGKPLWNFNNVPQPGEPGTNTWNDLPFNQRSGASSWTTGYYDPSLDLVFIGTGNTYNTAPLAARSSKPGVTNDALYTDSTLALRPKTGKLAWYFQHQANDLWDLDWVFERYIVNLPVDGKPTRAVVTSGKGAIVDALQAADGRYLFSINPGLQNVVKRIDPVTGRKFTDPDLIPGKTSKIVCPMSQGEKNWIPGSYDASKATLYMPMTEACMEAEPTDPGETSPLSSGVRWSLLPPPGSDGRYGLIQAYDLKTRTTKAIVRQRAPILTGVLATGGGVLFAGDLDRTFSAYDAVSGKVLWSTRLGDVPSAAPISFSVGGKQYVAVVAGYGTMLSGSFLSLVPEISVPSTPSSSIYVFALPGTASEGAAAERPRPQRHGTSPRSAS